MDWRGIEWVLPLYGLAMLALPVYGFIALRRRVRRGVLAKVRAFWYYAGLAGTPVMLYVLLCFGLVGLEEVAQMSVITEGLARSFLVVVGLGFMIWFASSLTFGVALVCARRSGSSPDPGVEPTP